MTDRKARHGSMVVTKIGGEYHVLFQPEDLPHHYLSVARFQDRGRAVTYAEIEGMWVDDDGTQQADALAIAAIADPKTGEPAAAPPAPSGGSPAPAPDRSTPVSKPEPIAHPVEAAPIAAPIVPPPRPAPPPAPAPTKPVSKPLPPSMAEAKERALNHYAQHGGSQIEVAAATGVPAGSLSGFMSAARRDGDPRIASGDAKREVTPQLARCIGTTAAPTPQKAEPPAAEVAAATGRPRTHAEIVAAAREAVPAPTFSRPGGATVRTG